MLIMWTRGLALTAVLVSILSVAVGYCQSEGTSFAKATSGLTICTVQLIEELIALAKYSLSLWQSLPIFACVKSHAIGWLNCFMFVSH